MLSTLSKFGVDVGAGVAAGLGVPVGGTKVAVGTSVAFTPQAESASLRMLRQRVLENHVETVFCSYYPMFCKGQPNGWRFTRVATRLS